MAKKNRLSAILFFVCGASIYLTLNSSLYRNFPSVPRRSLLVSQKPLNVSAIVQQKDTLSNSDVSNHHRTKEDKASAPCPHIIVQHEQESNITVNSYKQIFVPNAIGLKRNIEKCCNGKKLNDKRVYIRLHRGGDPAPKYDSQVFWLTEQWGSPHSRDNTEGFLDHVRESKYVWGSKIYEKEWFERSQRNKTMRMFDDVPFYLTLDWQKYNQSLQRSLPMQERTIDFFMFGLDNLRRSEIARRAKKAGLNFVNSNNDMWGDRYFEVLANVKVVVNVHYYPQAVLEVHRINPVLSLGHTIVSETSKDPALDEEYRDLVHFADYDEIVPLLVKIKESWGTAMTSKKRDQIKNPSKNLEITEKVLLNSTKSYHSSVMLYMKNPKELVLRLEKKVHKYLPRFCKIIETLE